MTTHEPTHRTLTGGFKRMASNWRCLTWCYFFSLLLGILGVIPVIVEAGNLLNHSMAARGIAGKLDMATLLNASSLITERPTGNIPASFALDVLFALLFFVFTPAILSIYLGDELASLGNLFRTGLRFFWRMVRLELLFGLIALVILGPLAGIRAALLTKLDATYVERDFFFWSLGLGLIVIAVALLLRLWCDLAQVILVERGTYRIGRVESRAAWRTLGPAWRLMFAGFFGLYFRFILIRLLGAAGLLLALFLWRAAPAGSVHLAFLLGQLGIFFFLASRLWQKGLVVEWFQQHAALITPHVEPLIAPEVPAYVEETPEPPPPPAEGLGEPA